MKHKLTWMITFAFVALYAAFALPALAQDVQVTPPALDPGSDPSGFAQVVWDAITAKNWRLLATLAAVGITWALRKYGGKVWPWTQTDRGGAVLGMAMGAATTIALGLVAGKPLNLDLLLTALGMGTGTLGMFTLWKKGVKGGSKERPTDPPGA